MKLLRGLFRIVFSRFTLAICSLALQIAIIFVGISFFSEYIVWLFGGFTTLSIIVVIYILNKNQDYCVTIPMRKTTRSLNLSNSVAIAAYEAVRQLNIQLD